MKIFYSTFKTFSRIFCVNGNTGFRNESRISIYTKYFKCHIRKTYN